MRSARSIRLLCALSVVTPIAAVAQTGNAITLEEIVVTAQKRSENVRDVPASISVLGAEQLQTLGATRLTDYATYVPGFNVDTAGAPGQTSLTLRGVAPLGPGSTVGSYVDDSPLGSSSNFAAAGLFALDLLPYDVERIEVLRGPQGTLYGASTMGGLLKYVMRTPDLDRYEAKVGADVFDVAGAGDTGRSVRARASMPLIPGKLALQASYFDARTPGYIDNATNGARDENDTTQRGGRMSALWQASETLTVKLGALLQRIRSDDNAIMTFDTDTQRPAYGDLTSAHPLPQPFEQDLKLYNATVDWNVGWADFTSASSYSRTSTDRIQDNSVVFGPLFPLFTDGAVPAGLAPFTLKLGLEKFTQELRLASPGAQRFEWLAGIFYTREDSDNFQGVGALDSSGTPIVGLDPLVVSIMPTTYHEFAVFGDVTWRFSDTFDATAGLRWARNEQRFEEFDEGPLVGGVLENLNEASENVTTFLLSSRWHATDATMLYARVASGYRPGGPNFALPNIPPTVDSDTLVNYELGVKSELLDGRATLDVAAFRVDWEDIQLAVSSGGISYLANGGTARSEGVELTFAFRPTQRLQLNLNGAYTDATLTEDVPSLAGVSGARLSSVPRLSAAASADYSFPLFGSGWEGRVGAGVRHVGDRYSLVESNPLAVRAHSYEVFDVNASVSNDRWTIRLYSRNLLDERAELTPSFITDAFGTPVQIDTAIMQPRTIGLALDVAF